MSQEGKWDHTTTTEEVLKKYADQVKGRNVVITGVSLDGMGAAFASALAGAGAGLIVCTGRSKAKLDEAIASIKAEHPSANLRALLFDLADLDSARKAGEEVLKYSEPIHILATNAGVMAAPFSRTKQGFESQFGANHLGHFVFVNTMLPRLLASATPEFTPRFLSIGSIAHGRSDILWDDPIFRDESKYEAWTAYGQSKTANLLFAISMRDAGIKLTTFAVHPGFVATKLSRHMSAEDMKQSGWVDDDGNQKEFMDYLGEKIYIKTPSQGASAYAVAAFDPTIEKYNGGYFNENILDNSRAAEYARSSESASRLWKLSEELVGQTFDLKKL